MSARTEGEANFTGNTLQYEFPYNTIAPVDIPASHPVEVYTVRAIDGVREEPEAVIAASLAAPIGMQRLSRMVNAGSRILIIVDDVSRPTPVHQILPPLLSELARGGAQDANIRFLVALGTHRHMTGEEIAAKIGAGPAARFPVINHEWDNPAALHDLLPSSVTFSPAKTRYIVERIISCRGIRPHGVVHVVV